MRATREMLQQSQERVILQQSCVKESVWYIHMYRYYHVSHYRVIPEGYFAFCSVCCAGLCHLLRASVSCIMWHVVLCGFMRETCSRHTRVVMYMQCVRGLMRETRSSHTRVLCCTWCCVA